MSTHTSPKRRGSAVVLVALAVVLGVPTIHSLLAADGAAFIDTVDVEVTGRDTVLGTLRPAQERESFPIVLPRGAKLKASAKGLGQDAPGLVISVFDPEDALLVTTAPAKSGRSSRSVKTPRITAVASGTHRVRVHGDGVFDGDYKLKVKAKMPRSASAASDVDLAAGAAATFTFGAGAGASATITVAAAKRSALVPTVLEITGPGAFALVVPPPERPGSRHVVRGTALPVSGDYTVRFRNDGALPGGWTAKVRLKTPKARKTTVTITDDVLAGEFAGEQAVYARAIGAPGGVVTPTGDAGDLLGVSVDVPPGAVGEPTLFSVSPADPFFVDDDIHAGGATFELGPSGVAFSEDVTVTVPFDAQSYDDPGSEVQIAIRDGDTGDVAVVTGTVDVLAGTVTFQTPHFSGFQAVSPRPRPLRGGFVELQVIAGIDAQFGGEFTLALNSLTGLKGPRTGNVVARGLDRRTMLFGGDEGGATLTGRRERASDTGRATADRELSLTFGEEVASYARGRSPDVLLRGDVAFDRTNLSVLLRRVRGAPTQGALRGDWHGIVLEMAATREPGEFVVATTGQRVGLSVGVAGRAVVTSSDMFVSRMTYPAGTHTSDRFRKPAKPGTLRPSGKLARLTLDVGAAGDLPSIDLYPVVRGDMLIGTTGRFVGDVQNLSAAMARLVILVRAGAHGSDGDLAGRSQFVSVDSTFASVSPGGPPAPALVLLDLDVIHDGTGGLLARGTSFLVLPDASGVPFVDARTVDDTADYRIQKDLSYGESLPLQRGAVLRRRGLYVVTAFTAGRKALGFGMPSRPAAK